MVNNNFRLLIHKVYIKFIKHSILTSNILIYNLMLNLVRYKQLLLEDIKHIYFLEHQVNIIHQDKVIFHMIYYQKMVYILLNICLLMFMNNQLNQLDKQYILDFNQNYQGKRQVYILYFQDHYNLKHQQHKQYIYLQFQLGMQKLQLQQQQSIHILMNMLLHWLHQHINLHQYHMKYMFLQ